MLYPLNPSDAERFELMINIKRVYAARTADQMIRGLEWYRTANQLASMLHEDVKVGAGVIAAFSPNTQWPVNLRRATEACAGVGVHTMRDMLRKVERIMNGEDPLDVLPRGSKTWNFYRCIYNPLDFEAVVIDRHAHDVAVGRAYGTADRGLESIRRYAVFAEAYRRAAEDLHLRPLELQAIVWVVWTERNK